jgi:hypothetical protein
LSTYFTNQRATLITLKILQRIEEKIYVYKNIVIRITPATICCYS